MSQVLVAECIAKRFGARQVLTSASLRATAGEVCALVGRNGAGKSTLLEVAAGWIAPDAGSVRFADTAYLDATLPALARAGLFYLPDHDLLSPAFTVRTQLDWLRRLGGGAPATVDEAAAAAGIAHVLDRRPATLSGGELRRAEVAAALVRAPVCLLADEPYRGVAPRDAEILTTVFRALAERGCAVVLTGHEIETVLASADRITWCTAGTTYELGAPATAVLDERFGREYLGPRWSAPAASERGR